MATTIGPADAYVTNITLQPDGSVSYVVVATRPEANPQPYTITLAPEAFREFYVDVAAEWIRNDDHGGNFNPLLAAGADVAIALGMVTPQQYQRWLATGHDMQIVAFPGFTPYDYDFLAQPRVPSPLQIVTSPPQFALLGVNAGDPFTMSVVGQVSHPPGWGAPSNPGPGNAWMAEDLAISSSPAFAGTEPAEPDLTIEMIGVAPPGLSGY